ncbi:polysaccharide biosynthesis tyrosine autokinase [Arthrobacter sp. CC3]|uniref:polysaccharide biosynthesis tyrosine autokinase n=1 Tax=Arthrobacter sp. CC3 TaxID=3029185 RepID=UPI003263929D
MALSDYVRILRRDWMPIIALALAGLIASGVISILVKPTYTSTTQLFVAIQSSGSVTELQQGNTFSQARVQSYVKTVTTPLVLQPVIDSLGLDVTPQELANRVKSSGDVNTVFINISVSDVSPVQSAAIAQAVAESLVRTIDTLEKPTVGGTSPVNLSVVTPATAPVEPSAPNTKLNLILGLLVGLVLGLATAVLRTTLDTRVRGEADVRRVTEAPLLGGIAFDPDASKNPLLTQAGQQSPRAEAFRQLRTNLQFAQVSNTSKSLLVTSSLPGEGKSTTATNLAVSLAQSGLAVVLVDADLRRPMVSEYLGLERNVGLTTALLGQAELDDVLQPWGDDRLYVLTSGRIPPNPSELLGSKQMRKLIVELEANFDAVIIDAPPLLPVTDSAVLAQHVGGVVLIVGSQKVRQPDLAKSLSALEMVGADVLGLVLNRLPVKGPDAYSYTYYSSVDTYSPPKVSSKQRRVEDDSDSEHLANGHDWDPTDPFDRTLQDREAREPVSFPGGGAGPSRRA